MVLALRYIIAPRAASRIRERSIHAALPQATIRRRPIKKLDPLTPKRLLRHQPQRTSS
jgi:hypothetical protein